MTKLKRKLSKKEQTELDKIEADRARCKEYDRWNKYKRDNKKNVKRKRYAMFGYDQYGNIVGFCNDSFSMSNRYGCVHLWDSPPNHYYDPNYYFIVCVTKEYPDIRMCESVTPLNFKKGHVFKGNYYFEQINAETGNWTTFSDQGPVRELSTLKEGRRLRKEWMTEKETV